MTQRSGLFVPAALAAIFVVPAVAWQEGSTASLQEALQRTVAALEALAGLGERIAGGDRQAVPQLLAATEPALGEEPSPGEALTQLRGEVAALEIELDGLHAAMPGATPGHTGARLPSEQDSVLPLTTGLDDATRALLADPPPVAAESGPLGPSLQDPPAQTGPGRASTKRSFEEPGYAADPFRLARAYYRQGQWEQALALLAEPSANPEEAYWRARCLDKLGRFDEAVAAYEALAADPGGGTHAQRAREDLEFLRWRRQFEARREAARGKDVR